MKKKNHIGKGHEPYKWGTSNVNYSIQYEAVRLLGDESTTFLVTRLRPFWCESQHLDPAVR